MNFQYDNRNYSVKNFKKLFIEAMVKSEEGLDEFVRLYLWARDRIKELHRAWPSYSQEWAISQFKRTFRMEPETYVRTALRIGQGSDLKHFEIGNAIIKRFGVYETFRADTLLGPVQMAKILKKIGPKATTDKFKAAVDELREKEIESINKKEEKASKKTKARREFKKTDYKVKYDNLLVKCKKLESKNKELKQRLKWYTENVVITAAGTPA